MLFCMAMRNANQIIPKVDMDMANGGGNATTFALKKQTVDGCGRFCGYEI